MLAFENEEIEPYWFETATPTFLTRKVKADGINAAHLNGVSRSRESLITVGIGSDDIIPLMFQTGYLTIVSYDRRKKRYELGFPNREVEIGFARNLLPLYSPASKDPDSLFGIFSFQDDLFYGRPDDFMRRLGTLLKTIPYGMHGENIYQSIAYLICTLSSMDTQPEQHSYKGRSDMEVFTPDFIYIFEFKFNRSVEEALAQIHERDYAGRHALDHRQVYLIGANFSDKKEQQGLKGYVIEKVEAG